jgi:hypothetical protein
MAKRKNIKQTSQVTLTLTVSRSFAAKLKLIAEHHREKPAQTLERVTTVTIDSAYREILPLANPCPFQG